MRAATGRRPGMPAVEADRRRAAQLIGASSIEISPREELAGESLRELFEPGTRVFVNHPGTVTHHDIVAVCAKLQRAGFIPVPHVAARRLASFTQARDYLQRAAAEAGVTSVLLIGGDPDHPVGPFSGSFDLLETGVSRPMASARSSSPDIPRAIRGSTATHSTPRSMPKYPLRGSVISPCH